MCGPWGGGVEVEDGAGREKGRERGGGLAGEGGRREEKEQGGYMNIEVALDEEIRTVGSGRGHWCSPKVGLEGT